MTAVAAPADLTATVKRADKRYADKVGDDPAPSEYVTAIVNAVKPLLGAPDPAVLGELAELRAAKDRRDALLEELRKTADSRARVIDGQKAELATISAAANGAAAEAERHRIANGRLAEDLAAARDRAERLDAELGAARAALQEKQRLVREQAARLERHRHDYPWPDPSRPPQACECGHPWPLTKPRPAPPVPSPEVVDPWDRIRSELKDWPTR